MNKSDSRIKKTNHTTPEPAGNKPVDSVKTYPTPHPCDDGDTPQVPDKPTPNPDRPKRKGSTTDELVYTNGVQKVGNTVSVKVHPDSTNYMRTNKDGLSIRYLINKLECVRKSIIKLNNNVNQLKEDVQPATIIEHIIDNSKEFDKDEDGMLVIKIGDGLGTDEHDRLVVKYDGDTIGVDENGCIMTIWGEFSQE